MSGRDDASPGAAWPLRLSHLLQLLAGQLDAASRSSIRAEAWLLLHPTLSRYARLHAAKIGPIAKEEIEDLASSKSLDLLSRTESGMWNTSERSGPEIAGYLSKVALNGLRDRYRRESRFEPGLEGDFGDGNASDRPNPSVRVIASTTEAPDMGHERAAFAQALVGCIGSLQHRSRKIWFLRVFFDLSSKDIAEHPEVGLKSSHVDVLLQRTRQTVRECMLRRGFEPSEMPPGSFAEVWQFVHRSEQTEREPDSLPGGAG